MPVKWFTKFDKEEIKTEIINHLKEHKTDVLEFCKEFSKKDLKRYVGYNIIDFYQNNKEVPSKVVLRGNKEYFKPLTN
jgi:hypothetical protein